MVSVLPALLPEDLPPPLSALSPHAATVSASPATSAAARPMLPLMSTFSLLLRPQTAVGPADRLETYAFEAFDVVVEAIGAAAQAPFVKGDRAGVGVDRVHG